MKNLFFLLLIGSLSLGTQAQTAEEIVDQYLENIGGVKAWKKLKTTKMTGKMSMQGMDLPYTMYTKAPNKEYVEMNVMGKKIVEAYNGDFVWRINPFMGGTEPQKGTEEESTEKAKTGATDNKFIDWKEKGSKMEFLGREEVEGTSCFVIKFTSKEGDKSKTYFDSDTYAPVMETSVVETEGPMQGKESRIYYSEYTEVDGLYFAFRTVSKVDGQTILDMIVEKIEINVNINDTQFEMPK